MPSSTSTTSERDDCHLDQETVHGLLQARRRREVVAAVLAADGPVPADALATTIAAAERRNPPDRLDEGIRRSVRATLDETHLPRLEAACAIREREDGYVPGENAEALASVMDATAAAL